MVWKVILRRTRITQSCGKTRTILYYLIYDGDWLRCETKNKDDVEKFMLKCGCEEEEINEIKKQLKNF